VPDQALFLDSLIGFEFSHYRIIEKTGSGGMGVVYRAHDQHLDREVAIKVLTPGTITDEAARKHLRKEALVLSKLNHPHIATVYDFDTQRGVDFLVMEYIPGITLSEKLAGGPLPEKEVLRLGMQLADGLAAAHEHGVVHRDLKPGNVRLTSDGRLKILDFGIAKLRQPWTETTVAESSLQTHSISGTLPYMAPEQLSGEEVDARTDIHGAGFVLYEMATGQRPFAEVPSEQLIGALMRKPPIPPTKLNHKVSAELERIIEKCVEKDPENRYQSAKELDIDLQRLQRETYAAPSKTEAHHGQSPWGLFSRWRLVALVSVSILVLAVAAKRWQKYTPWRPPTVTIASIAVLPFADLSPNHDQEYFSDGLGEELLNDLTKIPDLRVAARASAFRFKGKNEELQVIGEKLNVANILEGSVRRDGNHVRINTQLIRANDGFNLWSESYDRDLKDVFVVQGEIAAAVTSALQLKLRTGKSSASLPVPKTTNPEAYEAYLHARYFSHMYDKESSAKALEYANKAIQLDFNYAPAYAMRATIALVRGGALWMNASEATEMARRDTEKVIALDPNLADGYRLLSTIQAEVESNCREAEISLQRARELAPGDPDNLGRSALLAMCQGRQEKAIELLQQELGLDPLRPNEYTSLAQCLLYLGRYEKAHVALEKGLDLNPRQGMIHEIRGEVYLAQGHSEEALAEMEKEPEDEYRDLGKALACHALGRRQESDAALARLISQHQDDAAYQIAQVFAYRGETDQAFEWLNRAYRQHDPGLEWLKSDLKMKNLQNDPRYAQLLRKLNLPVG
jgi:eukaryotic-like serine/threonine-protein kinase